MAIRTIQSVLGSNAVGSAAITDLSISTADIAANAITTAKIADSAVTSVKLGTIYAANISGLGSLATASSVANTQITGNIISSQIQPTGVTSGSYGNATHIPSVTVNDQGQVTSASLTAFTSTLGVDVQTFTSSGTWTKPAGYSANSRVLLQAWGGGGSGGNGGGGGGGGYNHRWLPLSSLSSTETITIGAGGAAVSSNASGNTGGTTSIGTKLYAYGGAGGESSTSQGWGGGGGGQITAGGNVTGYYPRALYTGLPRAISGQPGQTPPSSDLDWQFEGNGGGTMNSVDMQPQAGNFKGGGGGGMNTGSGAPSVWGGGGGAGAAGGTGGTSTSGGAGGARNTNGTAPSGGGGARNNSGDSGAGGDGQVIITVFSA